MNVGNNESNKKTADRERNIQGNDGTVDKFPLNKMGMLQLFSYVDKLRMMEKNV